MLIKIREFKTLFNCHICAGGDGIFKEIADDIAKVGVIDHTGIRNVNHKMKGNLFCLCIWLCIRRKNYPNRET
jgi:hypothetical protein